MVDANMRCSRSTLTRNTPLTVSLGTKEQPVRLQAAIRLTECHCYSYRQGRLMNDPGFSAGLLVED